MKEAVDHCAYSPCQYHQECIDYSEEICILFLGRVWATLLFGKVLCIS